MAINSEPLDRGPKWLQGAFNDLRDDIIANRPAAGQGIQITETDKGGLINATGGTVAGGTTGTPETVTGAVNGVPSTLNVLTDGAGWTEI